jgi:hypothetical protein
MSSASPIRRRGHFTPEPSLGAGHRLTPRDEAILALLRSYRLMRTPHIVEHLRYTHPDGLSTQNLSRRLRTLMDAGHTIRVRNDPLAKAVARGSLSKIHALNIRRNQLLNERTTAAGQIVPHALSVSDTMAYSVVRACSANRRGLRFIDTDEILATMASEQTKKRAKPLTWKIKVHHQGKNLILANTPDRLFGVHPVNQKSANNSFFILEEDLSSETVLPKNLFKSTIYRKVFCYVFARFHKLPEQMYGTRNIRAIFVTSTKNRAKHMTEMFGLANQELKAFQRKAGFKPTGCPPNVFLFIDRPTLRQSDIFSAQWLNGQGKPHKIELS